MVTITYTNGRLSITSADGANIGFRVCDLQFADRAALTQAVSDISPVQQAGETGFLRTQPVEERERVLEEILGVPMDEMFDDKGRCI